MASGNRTLQLQQQKPTVKNHIESLRNEDLKNICRMNQQQVSGNKPVLVARVQKVLDDIVRREDLEAFESLKARLHITTQLPSLLPTQSAGSSIQQSSSAPMCRPYSNGTPRAGGVANGEKRTHELSRVMEKQTDESFAAFKTSPFYDIQEELLRLHVLPEMPQNRNTVRNNLKIQLDLGQRLRNDGSLKILLYCRETPDTTLQATIDVKFPTQIEVKVNNSEVKHNFKGLKNKAGSTKPADITGLLHKYTAQDNQISITYALTTKKYSYGIYLARYVSADTLVDRIKAGSFIPKDKVLRDMTKSNAESDIVATSVRLSLKDPVSTMRIGLPVRSSHCQHNQCFDGAMFLQLQEQAPQWNCPVCNKHVAFNSLCVDKYFEDILNRTSKATEKVEIQPSGEWHAVREDDEDDKLANCSTSKKRAAYDDDFDDLIELDEPVSKQVNGLKRESLQLPSWSPGAAQTSFSIQTPPLSSREASVAQSASSTTQRPGNKRPQSTVIDLTLSDEDEDEPPRPAKRQSTIQSQRQSNTTTHSNTSYNTPISLPNPISFQLPPPPNQHSYSTSSSSLGQANNSFRSAVSYTQPNNNSTSATTQQRRQNYAPPNALNVHHHSSVSPSNHTASPFSPHPPSPAWPQQPRPATSVQHSSYQPQQQQQTSTSSLFPPPSASFPLRPPSAPSVQNMQSNLPSAMHGGLRLPPLQMGNSTSSNNHTSAFSPADLPQDSFTGWRDGGAFADEWDFGSFRSSPT